MSRLLAVVWLGAALAAQSSRPASQPASWMPVGLGAEWHMRRDGPPPNTLVQTCVCARLTRWGVAYGMTTDEPDEGRVRTDLVPMWHVEGANGLYQIGANSLRQSSDGTLRFHSRLLALPLGAVERWEWDQERWEMHQTGTLQSLRESVTVPAGTFDSVRVAIQTKSPRQTGAATVWLTRGVGIVKMRMHAGITDDGAIEGWVELEKFVPPRRPKTSDLAELATIAVDLHPDWKKLAPLTRATEIESKELRELSPYRCVRLELKGGEVRHALVRDTLLLEFDASDAEAWNALCVHRRDPSPLDADQRGAWSRACASVLGVPADEVELGWAGGVIEKLTVRAKK